MHRDHEFPLLAWTGHNLPGALVAEPVALGDLPAWALTGRDQAEPIQIDVKNSAQKFSLAGVQVKFSSSYQDGHFNISLSDEQSGSDDWIIKTPSTVHRHVPENEFTVMQLAQAIGVVIPDVQLVPLRQLDNLPGIPLPSEQIALAIYRFSDSGLADVQQMARRLLANILLANGDAHLKKLDGDVPLTSGTPFFHRLTISSAPCRM